MLRGQRHIPSEKLRNDLLTLEVAIYNTNFPFLSHTFPIRVLVRISYNIVWELILGDYIFVSLALPDWLSINVVGRNLIKTNIGDLSVKEKKRKQSCLLVIVWDMWHSKEKIEGKMMCTVFMNVFKHSLNSYNYFSILKLREVIPWL